MNEYMNELNRLFPENVNFPQLPVHPSMYSPAIYRPAMGNQSSSSDSMSPESFPELSVLRSPETPVGSRHRPIIGRKIFTQDYPSYRNADSPTSRSFEDFSAPLWRPEEVSNPTRYELFPHRSQIHSPIKPPSFNPYESSLSPSKHSLVSSNLSHSPRNEFSMDSIPFSPHSSNISPSNINLSPHHFPIPRPNYAAVTRSNISQTPIRFPMNLSPENDGISRQKLCKFCKKNGETPVVYMTHDLRKKKGNRSVVSCPILRSYVCTTCGATGDDAHTITYCPALRNCNNGAPLQSTTVTLKNTKIKSNGRRRY